MKMPREDVLNALVTDLVADQTIRAMQLGYDRKDVEAAVTRGVSHGVYEFEARRKEMRETEKLIGSFKPGREDHGR